MSENLGEMFREIKPNGDEILIGLTGGIGSGKSMVAEMIRSAGYTVLSSDDIARELTATQKEIREEIFAEFGDDLEQEDGSLNRALLAERVFGSSPEHERNLQILNAIVHPFVIERLLEEVRALFAKGQRVVFNETALLFEAGLEDCYDYIVVVHAPEETRLQRTIQGRKMAEDDVRRRIKAQMSAEEKIAGADFTIDNSGSKTQTKNGVDFLLMILPALKPQTEE